MKTINERETMKTYIGTKIIQAKPMTRLEYYDFRHWLLPSDENGADEGYLVEYMDGGKSNVEGYAGYVSWSPKAQFDAAYIEIGDVSGMPAHQQRVVAEKAALDKKAIDLSNFIGNNPFFENLDLVERERLKLQHHFMSYYSIVLGERIAAFGVKV